MSKRNKLFLGAALLLTTQLSYGSDYYASITGGFRDRVDGEDNSSTTALTIGKKLNQNFAAEIFTRYLWKNDQNNTNNVRLEGALRGELPINTKFSLYERVAIGEKLMGAYSGAYWSSETGAMYKLTDKLKLGAGYRYRTEFDNTLVDTTYSPRLSAWYALDPATTIFGFVERERGDRDQNNITVGYSVKF